jgi:exoribonuclease R
MEQRIIDRTISGTISINQPQYKECVIINNTENSTIESQIDSNVIFNSKLFHNDTVTFDIINNEYLIKDIISKRSTYLIGGVLKLTSNIFYKDNSKYLYEFIPLNWKYPKFMVASEIKNNLIKRKEQISDYFVIIEFKNWIHKFPHGTIKHSIGPINNTLNQYNILFYYYPEHSFQLQQKFNFKLECSIQPYNISDVSDIYSIDPIGCRDIDDALSYDNINNKIGIHIADVIYTINKLKLNIHNYTTVYAPHKTINMLPDTITYEYCSLIELMIRPVISCWINMDTFEIELKREFIRVKKNYSYDDIEKINISSINVIMDFSKKLNNKYNLIDSILDSHHMVETYMIFLNQYIATYLKDEKIIYRNQEPQQFAEYSFDNKGHNLLKLKNYTHFTSPIRRYVDQYVHSVLINKLFQKIEINDVSIDKINLYEKQLKKVERYWNNIIINNKIKNGSIYKLEFIQFNSMRIEFKLIDYNIIINNKLFFDIINNTTIKINENIYEIGKCYLLPIYSINDLKNNYFPKILIKFI